MPVKLRLQPNIPVTIQLVNPEGDYDFELQKGCYDLKDGRMLVLPRAGVIALNELEPRAGEEMGVCYRTPPGKPPRWDFWLTPRSEQVRALEETHPVEAEEPSELAKKLQATIDELHKGKAAVGLPTPIRRPIQRDIEPRGTGTDGPASQPEPVTVPAMAASGRRKPPVDQIPCNVAIKEILGFLKLDPGTEGWSDQARQDLASTILIAEYKAGRIARWERGE